MPRPIDSLHRRPKGKQEKKTESIKIETAKKTAPETPDEIKPKAKAESGERVDKVGDFFLTYRKAEKSKPKSDLELFEEKPDKEPGIEGPAEKPAEAPPKEIPITKTAKVETRHQDDDVEPKPKVTGRSHGGPSLLSIDRTETFITYVLLIIGIIIIIIGVGIVLIFRTQPAADSKPISVETSRPAELSQQATETIPAESKPAETPTPPVIDKASIKLNVLNGTGKTGDAATAKTTIESKGWKVGTIGNAANVHPKTTIYFHTGKKTEAEALKADMADQNPQLVESNDIVGDLDLIYVVGQS